MKIHEYQAKALFRRHEVAVLPSLLVEQASQAAVAFDKLGGGVVVVKAQIHAGGRGKGTVLDDPEQHGVQLVRCAAQATAAAERLLGKKLVTIQTGPEGRTIRRLLFEKGCDIQRELYLGIVLDRAAGRPVMMYSTEGGVEIEKVAAEQPERIFKEHFHPALGVQPFQVRKFCHNMNLTGSAAPAAATFLPALARLYVERDCSLVEINPLVVTGEGDLLALDAKMSFDDNALYRQEEVVVLRDLDEEEPTEIEAAEAGLSYMKLDGNIGCMVNGAGLAMSTMDIIKLHGGTPANFLDVGGGANVEQVRKAFRILTADPNVRAVLVNIFGGIMRCTTIATALCEAYRAVGGLSVPLVVRLEGTEVEAGKKILAESGIDLIMADGLTEAAKKVVAAAGA